MRERERGRRRGKTGETERQVETQGQRESGEARDK